MPWNAFCTAAKPKKVVSGLNYQRVYCQEPGLKTTMYLEKYGCNVKSIYYNKCSPVFV